MTGAFYYGESYPTEKEARICGAGLTILKTDPPMEGISICTQALGHNGPHVGNIAWREETQETPNDP